MTSAPSPQRRDQNGRFLPGGSSLNPGGRPAVLREVQEVARQHTAAAISRLLELLGSNDGRIALAAAEQLLDRGWGKPMQMQQADVRKLDVGALWLGAMQIANGIDPATGAKLVDGTDTGAADTLDDETQDGAAEPSVDW